MLVIAVLLGAAAPSLRGFAQGRSDADAAASVLAMTHMAQNLAATMGTVSRLNFDFQTNTYWVTVQQAGAFVDLQTDLGRPFALPKGMSFRLELPPGQEQRPYLQFLPDGRSEQALVSLINRDGEIYRVYCPSATERFRIIKPWEQQP